MKTEKRQKQNPIHALLSFIMILIIALSSLLIIYVAISVGDKSVFGYRMFVVISESMGTTIRKDELILTKKVPKEELYEGQIITFISSDPKIKGEYNTHRIHRIINDDYYTKGDGNNYVDNTTTKYEDIVGKVTWHSMIIGKIIKFLQSPEKLIFLVLLPIFIFTSISFSDVIKKIKPFIKKNNKQNLMKRGNDEK